MNLIKKVYDKMSDNLYLAHVAPSLAKRLEISLRQLRIIAEVLRDQGHEDSAESIKLLAESLENYED